MFAAVDAPVRRLARIRLGTLRLEDLASGEVRELTPTEIRRLR
jgi:16S rRNA U516 pseudouridylate synthase RsuA-like enzyme